LPAPVRPEGQAVLEDRADRFASDALRASRSLLPSTSLWDQLGQAVPQVLALRSGPVGRLHLVVQLVLGDLRTLSTRPWQRGRQ
jgi:hypothetical protein